MTGPPTTLSQSERSSPTCETQAIPTLSPNVSSIGNSFVCRIAGFSDYANPILAEPSSYTGVNAAIKTFAEYFKSGKLALLNTNQMLNLAVALEELTEEGTIRDHNHEVGKDKQTAILSKGAITEFETVPNPTEASSEVMSGVHIINQPNFHGYPGAGMLPSGSHVRVITINSEFVDFRVLLDGNFYAKDNFRRMRLVANGTEPIYFNPDNVVEDSDLVLGPKVNYDDPSIQKPIHEHNWRYIFRAPQNLGMGPYSSPVSGHPAN